jgi:hypothetical protein
VVSVQGEVDIQDLRCFVLARCGSSAVKLGHLRRRERDA